MSEQVVEPDNPFLNLDENAIDNSWLEKTDESDWGVEPVKFDELENVI